MNPASVSRMVEDYVTLIWKARELPGDQPATTDLAAQLGVTPSTVSANLKRLARDGYIQYEPYGSIDLTDAGRSIAVNIVRRHRIVETYLVERLGLSWDQVHEEAHELEHAISDLVLGRMDAALGHPTHDPHGDPIPDAAGRVPPERSAPLSTIEPGTAVTVVRVSDRSAEVLRYLADHGVQVGVSLVVTGVNPAAAAVQIDIGERSEELGLTAAEAVRVEPSALSGATGE